MTLQVQSQQIWDNLGFVKLLRTFRLAIRPTRLLTALLAVLVICLFGWILDFSNSVAADENGCTELQAYISDPETTDEFIKNNTDVELQSGVFATLWHYSAARFNGATVSLFRLKIPEVFVNIWLCVRALFWALKYHIVYSIIYLPICSAIICLCGGAICRSAALEFSGGQKPGIGEMLRFSFSNFHNFLTAPVLAFGMTVFFGLFIFLLGLIGNLPWAGELIVAILLWVALACSLLTVFLLVGTVASGALMFPVIAYECSDGFDAISRSFTYVFTKPWPMLCYMSIATFYGTVSYLVVRFLVFLVLIVTYNLLDLGLFVKVADVEKLTVIWPKPEFLSLIGSGVIEPSNILLDFSSFIIQVTVFLVVATVLAFVISFCFCANTIIYSLMRKNVEHTPIDTISTNLDNICSGIDEPVQRSI